MTPRPKTARRVSAPPEKRLRKPSTPLAPALDCRSWTWDQLTPGMGRLAPSWYRQMIETVNRTLLRRSATRKMFASLRSTSDLAVLVLVARGGRTHREREIEQGQRAAGRLERRARRRRRRMHARVDRTVERPASEQLDQVALLGQAVCDQDVGVDLAQAQRGQRVEIDGRVGDPEGVGEALQLRDALDDRVLAALELGGDLATSLLTLGAAAGGLAALAGDAAAHDLAPRGGAARGLEFVELHLDLFDFDQMGYACDHPTDLGTVGQHVALADAAQTQGAQRPAVLGFGADGRPSLGDLQLAHQETSGTLNRSPSRWRSR